MFGGWGGEEHRKWTKRGEKTLFSLAWHGVGDRVKDRGSYLESFFAASTAHASAQHGTDSGEQGSGKNDASSIACWVTKEYTIR